MLDGVARGIVELAEAAAACAGGSSEIAAGDWS